VRPSVCLSVHPSVWLSVCDLASTPQQLNSVTDDPGSNPDQKYARRRDRQIYKLEEKSNKLGLEQKIPISIEYFDMLCTWELQGYLY
jgi:hypothetical protein